MPSSSDVPFPCTSQWVGPNASNTFDTCDGSTINDWIWSHPLLWSCFIPALIGILFLFPTSCLVIFGRYCCNCCGSSKMRPSSFCGCADGTVDDCCCSAIAAHTCLDACEVCGCDSNSMYLAGRDDDRPKPQLFGMYSKCFTIFIQLLSCTMVAVAVVGVVFSYLGGAKMGGSINDVMPTVDNIERWAFSVLSDTKKGIADPNNSSSYPDGFDPSSFDTVEDRIHSYKKDISDFFDENDGTIKAVTQVISFAAIFPGGILVLPLIAVIFHLRKCLPLVFVLFSYGFQFIYLLFGSIFMVLFVALTIVCDDVANSTDSDSGSGSIPSRSVTAWYFIPRCEKEAPFAEVFDNINAVETDASREGCVQLLQFCSTSTSYDATGAPAMIFYCNLVDAAAECKSFENLTAVVDSMYVKTGVPSDSQGCGADVANADCTLEVCGEKCVNPTTQSAAKDAVDQIAVATRVFNTFDTVLRPWLNCKALVKKVMDSGAEATCYDLRDASGFLRIGALVIGFGCLFAVILGLLGQKRYFSVRDTVFGSSSSSDDSWKYNASTGSPLASPTETSGWWNGGGGGRGGGKKGRGYGSGDHNQQQYSQQQMHEYTPKSSSGAVGGGHHHYSANTATDARPPAAHRQQQFEEESNQNFYYNKYRKGGAAAQYSPSENVPPPAMGRENRY